MLIEIGLPGALRMLLAGILYLGPGFALYQFFPDRKCFDKTGASMLVFLFSASFWPLLLVWLLWLPVRLSALPALVIALAGWTVGILRLAREEGNTLSLRLSGRGFDRRKLDLVNMFSRFLLWGLLAGILVVGFYVLRTWVVGPGSDSYHHSLIAQMIMDSGRLPRDYSPYTDQVVTFSYHFGFHVTTAVLGWFSGQPAYRVVLILGILWVALAALSVSFLTEQVTRSRLGGFAAAAVTGVICVFPTHMLNWGRYPQLEGLLFLPVFAILLKQALEAKPDWRRILFLGFLAAGLGTIHYRASLMTMVSAVALLAVLWAFGKLRASSWQISIAQLAGVGAGALLLFAPWILFVMIDRQQGYSLVVTQSTPDFSSFSRLGDFVTGYPSNFFLLALAGVAFIWGLIRRDVVIYWLLVWAALAWFLSQPRISGVFMDRVSSILAVYIPVSVAIGWLVAQMIKPGSRFPNWGKALLILFTMGVTFWSVPGMARNFRFGTPFVQADDLNAFSWIRENTPGSAYFMVNLYHFPFSPDLIIATDAGYWLPLFAGRKTVSLPMSYMSEKFRSPEGIDFLKKLDALNGHLCTTDAVQQMEAQGITYVYVGAVGGRISLEELQNCPDYQQVYNFNHSYVFQLRSQQGMQRP